METKKQKEHTYITQAQQAAMCVVRTDVIFPLKLSAERTKTKIITKITPTSLRETRERGRAPFAAQLLPAGASS